MIISNIHLLLLSLLLCFSMCVCVCDVVSTCGSCGAYETRVYTVKCGQTLPVIRALSSLSEPPAQPALRQQEDPSYDPNPFIEPDEPGTRTPPGNPFDEPDQDVDLHPDPEPPKPRPRKGVRPVDMSKYLYADTTHNEDDELDE